jgi:hypothetical protein
LIHWGLTARGPVGDASQFCSGGAAGPLCRKVNQWEAIEKS